MCWIKVLEGIAIQASRKGYDVKFKGGQWYVLVEPLKEIAPLTS
jgi:hypothetical protein